MIISASIHRRPALLTSWACNIVKREQQTCRRSAAALSSKREYARRALPKSGRRIGERPSIVCMRQYDAGFWRFISSTSNPVRCSATSTVIDKSGSTKIHPLNSDRLYPIRILYASQGGTAQLFANQLAEALEEEVDGDDVEISIQGWHEHPRHHPSELLTPGKGLHIFLASVTGVGDPPDNGRSFYEWITNSIGDDNTNFEWNKLEYTVFGLGNSKAHPNHYNVIGIGLDKRLEELGAKRVHPLGLGDDGECIEDDFDKWMEGLLQAVSVKWNGTPDTTTSIGDLVDDESSPAEVDSDMLIAETPSMENQSLLPRTTCLPGVAKSSDNTRVISAKHPTLQLSPPQNRSVCHDLFHLHQQQHYPSNTFYAANTVKAQVTRSRSLSAYGGEAGLREVAVSSSSTAQLSYETGDHCLVYPRNSNCVVESYLNILDVDPHAIIEGTVDHGTSSYPYPKGLSVYETLSHCVDLGAVPSPSFARLLLGRRDLDYKQDIAFPRRTVVDLLLEQSATSPNRTPAVLSLEDLLYNLTPMKPRYYSIASSSVASPDQVLITFRPVKYMTSRGLLREGICTSFMSTMMAGRAATRMIGRQGEDAINAGEDDTTQYMPVCIAKNPTFRLPHDPQTPVLLIAGGCGVAPIRAFVEERMAMVQQNGTQFGPGMLFLGFRNPEDEVYRSLVHQALEVGALTNARVAYSHGGCPGTQNCMNVNELIRNYSEVVWNHIESGGVTYLCGGARTFGAAIEQELLEIIQEQGGMDFPAAEQYMRNLLDTGRILEDLAD